MSAVIEGSRPVTEEEKKQAEELAAKEDQKRREFIETNKEIVGIINESWLTNDAKYWEEFAKITKKMIDKRNHLRYRWVNEFGKTPMYILETPQTQYVDALIMAFNMYSSRASLGHGLSDAGRLSAQPLDKRP